MENDELIQELVNDLRKEVPENETELIESYKNYLYFSVENTLNSDSKFISKDKESIQSYLRFFSKTFMNYSLERKKQFLQMDKSFTRLRELSNEVFLKAQNALNGSAEESTDIIKYREELNNLLEKVEPYNKVEAQKLVSEAMLDLNFISNPGNDVMSLRLGHFVSSTNKKTEEER